MRDKEKARIVSMRWVAAHCTQLGSFWFTSGAKRFFSSRVAKEGYRVGEKVFFISSERFVGAGSSGPRLYSVNIVNLENGRVERGSEFQEFSTRSAALGRLRKVLEDDVQLCR